MTNNANKKTAPKGKGNLIVFSGPSGVGKNALRKILFMDTSLNLQFSVSNTTRAQREGEVDGVDYNFCTKEEFAKMIQKDELIEYAVYVDNYYGTSKKAVEKMLNDGKNVFLEIEVQGALKVMDNFPNAVTIFIAPPSIEELEKRLTARATEDKEIIKERLEQAKFEMTLKSKYKHVVTNDHLIEAAAKVSKIIRGDAK